MRFLIILFVYLILFISPSFGQSLQYDSLKAIAQKSFEEGNYQLAATQFHSAFNVLGGKGYPQDRYNASIAWTIIGEKDSAFYNLFRLAEKTTFLEYNLLIKEDKFLRLKTDQRWLELLHIINPKNEIYNDSLSKVLSSIRDKDQKFRYLLDAERRPYNEESTDTFKSILKTMIINDSLNLIIVEAIIDKYGWLSRNEVGFEESSALWLVIQHSNLKVQEKYFPVMKEAVKNGRADKMQLAMLEDRILMNQGKKQLYGTQYRLNEISKQMELWEIEDPINLNKRREAVGLSPM